MVSNISGEIITDLKMDVGLMDVQVMPYIIHQYLFQIRFEQYGILSTKITDIFIGINSIVCLNNIKCISVSNKKNNYGNNNSNR